MILKRSCKSYWYDCEMDCWRGNYAVYRRVI